MFRYQAYCLNFSSDIPLTECFEANSGQDDFTIKITRLEPPVLSATTIHRRGIMAHTAIGDNGALWLHWDGIATFRATGGTLLEVDPHVDDPDLLSLFTLSEALGLILFQRGNFLLHASAVQVGDKSWVFLGQPGAGKSTTCAAFVKAGCTLLSDDLVAIHFGPDEQPFLRPAYPQLKIWENTVKGLGFSKEDLSPVSEGVNKFALQPRDNFNFEPVPLQRMYFLDNASTTRPLKVTELPAETLKHFPLPNQFLTPETLKQLFLQSILLGNRVDGIVISRFTDFDSLEQWVYNCLSSQQ